MPTAFALGEVVSLPLRGELRYGLELARLAADPQFVLPRRQADAPPVLLVPGFMAGDQSLALLRGWLIRRGCPTATAGIRLNVDCGERVTGRIEARLRKLAGRTGRRVVLIGQSRGGELARVVAVRNPDARERLVMLGSPVLAPLNVGRERDEHTVRSVARLGDMGVPGVVLEPVCADGECCADFRQDLGTSLPGGVRAVAIYSRSDGIVAWRSCLDPDARHVEVRSSHTGMSVNRDVYRVLDGLLEQEGDGSPWSG